MVVGELERFLGVRVGADESELGRRIDGRGGSGVVDVHVLVDAVLLAEDISQTHCGDG